MVYEVTVTDANGCVVTDEVSVQVEANPDVTVTVEDLICGATSGSITFTFVDDPAQSTIEFSLNGGVDYETAVNDDQCKCDVRRTGCRHL